MFPSVRYRLVGASAAILALSSVINSAPVAAAPATPPRPNAAPQNLTISASKGAAVLQWTSTATNHQGFRVSHWDKTTRTWTVLGSVASTVLTFTDPAPGTARTYYHVCAFNAAGDYCSNGVSFGYDHPDGPSGLSGKIAAGGVQLDWTNTPGPNDGVRIYRWDTVGKSWVRIGTAAAGVTTFSAPDSGAARRSYHACSFNAKGEWCSSAIGVGYDHPESPAQLTGTLSAGAATLTWTNGQAPQDGVRVYRWDRAARNWARLGATGSTATSFADPSAGTGRQYYHACAFNARGEWCSTGVSVGYERPEAPSGLTGSLSGNAAQLSWANSQAPQDGVHVYRWDVATTRWTLLGTAAAPATTFSDASAGITRQHYHVCAFNGRGESCSAVASTGQDAPDPPTGLAATRTAGGVQLSWANGAAPQAGVHVARWDRTAKRWVQVASLPAGATSYTDTAPAGRQHYHVSGFTSKGERYSGIVTVN